MTAAKGKRTTAAPAPTADAVDAPASDTVLVRMKPGGPAGRLVVGRVTIDTHTPVRIPRDRFDALQAQYGLVEVTEP